MKKKKSKRWKGCYKEPFKGCPLKHRHPYAPTARRRSSRLPDVSLLMLSSISYPVIFMYASKTEKGPHRFRLLRQNVNDFVFSATVRPAHQPFLRCSALRFPRMVTNVCSSVPNFSSPALKRTCNHKTQHTFNPENQTKNQLSQTAVTRLKLTLSYSLRRPFTTARGRQQTMTVVA